MRGVILAGGLGTRLRPLTHIINKHLLPIYDRPMIMYPIDTLKEMGVTDILIVCGKEHVGGFGEFLSDGAELGINLTYKIQVGSKGIAHALALAEDFVGEEQFAVLLGDNIYSEPIKPPVACGLVVQEVENPQRFGVYHNGVIVEKPENPESNMAVTGLYFYTPEVFDFIRTLEPSARGEMEITDVNNWCLQNLPTEIIEYKGFWSDAGTFDSLLDSAKWAKENGKTA